MKNIALSIDQNLADNQNLLIQQTVMAERKRLLEFIKKRIPKQDDAEDILQDVFYELVNMHRLMKPVEQLASWLFTVAKNKITDRYRKKKPVSLDDQRVNNKHEGETYLLTDLLKSYDYSAETQIMREAIMNAVADALAELPQEQRDVFVAHEIEDKSFKEIAEETGVTLNTLLSRKRYAVLFLREKLKFMYDDIFAQ